MPMPAAQQPPARSRCATLGCNAAGVLRVTSSGRGARSQMACKSRSRHQLEPAPASSESMEQAGKAGRQAERNSAGFSQRMFGTSGFLPAVWPRRCARLPQKDVHCSTIGEKGMGSKGMGRHAMGSLMAVLGGAGSCGGWMGSRMKAGRRQRQPARRCRWGKTRRRLLRHRCKRCL